MVREWLIALTELAVPLIDLVALVVILTGTAQAVVYGARLAVSPAAGHHTARAIWLEYSRWLVAGLTFQLAADIIETSVTPDWEDIGRIGAIAVIRTFLNFFLERDQREMRELQRESGPPPRL
jgi:uncharacterized membrane protein